LAKRKRKKKSSIGTSLKYEVYGILLITLSVIALSGEATVGRSLSKLFGLVLGKFYFVIALVGIYVGLMVMIKRTWPSGWSIRKTGVVLFVLALTLYSSIAVMDDKTYPTGGLTAGYILQQLGADIRGALLETPPVSAVGEIQMPKQSISGGYAGAFQYSILYLLFGYIGSKFVLIVMFAISLMLITGRSYVDLARVIHKRGKRLLSLLRMKLFPPAAKGALATATAGGRGAKSKNDQALLASTDYDDDDEEDDEEELSPTRSPGKWKKLPIFSWLSDDASNKDAAQTEQGTALPNGAKKHKGQADWDELGDASDQKWDSYHGSDFPQGTAQLAPQDRAEDRPPWDDGLSTAGDGVETTPVATPDNWPQGVNSGQSASKDDHDEELHAGSSVSGLSSPALEPEEDVAGAVAIRPQSLAKPYQLPPMSLLSKPSGNKGNEGADMFDARRKLEATLESFGVRAKVLDVVRGPAVTRYEVQPASGVKVSRIVGLTDDIALALAAKDIRMEAPIPGKSAIGIEVPNTEVSMVTMREVMETPSFLNAPSKMSIAFGRDISGQTIVGNLARMPHLLVAGATGSGKSVCINGIITSILYKARPDEVKFLMIDPKMVELNVYNGIPHLLAPVVTDPRRASLALKKIVVEMEKRYELFSKSGTRNIEGYNGLMADNPAAILPLIVVIVDELADLMMVAAGDVEDAICRLAQMARAAGIHLIIATQRPSVDVITGVIKANIPSRIAFGVSSQVDSRTILDSVGAEKLLGRGDMLFLPVGMSKPIRVQGAFLSDQEVEAIVTFARGQAEAEYKEDLVPEIDESGVEEEVLDELFDQAVRIVLEAKQASVSLLQRRMRIGYNRAARLIDQMEARAVIGTYEGSKPREVLMTLDQYDASKISS